jgi:DNA-binding transcriptional ArsR family regulator
MHLNTEGFAMPSTDLVEEVAARLRLLADPTRLRIVCALGQGESDVGCLADLAGVGLPAVSQHLAKLRLAGVVRSQRQGQHMVYELIDARVDRLVADLLGGSGPAAPAGTGAGKKVPA